MRHGWGRITVACLFVALTAPFVGASTQHIVSPGQDLAGLADRIRPGDHVMLLPGHHRAIELDGLRGTADAPIRITSVDPAHRAVIGADTVGILLRDPAFIEIGSIDIEGARAAGIVVMRTSDESPPESVHLRDLSVTRIGPTGNRDAVRLAGVRGAEITSCRFEGWGGSAIDVAGSTDLTIRDCRFRGVEGFGQANAVEVRAGSERVRIVDCTFEATGAHAVAAGGNSPVEDFMPPLTDAAPHSRYEAVDVRVERCLIVGTACPLAVLHADEVLVRNNTIVNPETWVLVIANMQMDGRVAPAADVIVGYNLVVWRAGGLERLVHLGQGVEATGLVFEENLWWSPDFSARRAVLGALPGRVQWAQITIVDPVLDASYRPTVPEAALHGRDAR